MPDTATASPAGGATAATTAERLIDAAEVLFAAHGIDAVSLREINRAAGARNASALQYHFGGRDGLLGAVLAKHHHAVEARRHAMLDAYEANGTADLRTLAGALVRPSAAMLADGNGGPAYLQIMADLMNRPRPVIDPAALDDPASSIYRWRTLVARLLDNDATRLHRRFVAMRFAAVELARRARSAPHTDDRLFVSHLVDLVAGLLAAPLSDETRRLDAERAWAVGSKPDIVPDIRAPEAARMRSPGLERPGAKRQERAAQRRSPSGPSPKAPRAGSTAMPPHTT